MKVKAIRFSGMLWNWFTAFCFVFVFSWVKPVNFNQNVKFHLEKNNLNDQGPQGIFYCLYVIPANWGFKFVFWDLLILLPMFAVLEIPDLDPQICWKLDISSEMEINTKSNSDKKKRKRKEMKNEKISQFIVWKSPVVMTPGRCLFVAVWERQWKETTLVFFGWTGVVKSWQ